MHHHRGFTLIELLVVISIISILASLLLPTITIIREKARIQETGNNLRRIIEAQIGYSGTYGTYAFPSGADRPDNGGDMDAPAVQNGDNNIYVGRIFVHLARANELPNKLFVNQNSTIRPNQSYPYYESSYQDVAGIDDGDPSTPPLTDEEAQRWSYSFAYDWTAPQNSAAGRAMIGDRDPSIWGSKGACVAYGDGHTSFLVASNAGDPGVEVPLTVVPLDFASTWMLLGSNVRSGDFNAEDWIYSHDRGEGERNAWGIGRGSSTLCWVR
jgi:prepilin-type N-terminal cleavage/methylation domain-containing protein